jgi:hypothetical protein
VTCQRSQRHRAMFEGAVEEGEALRHRERDLAACGVRRPCAWSAAAPEAEPLLSPSAAEPSLRLRHAWSAAWSHACQHDDASSDRERRKPGSMQRREAHAQKSHFPLLGRLAFLRRALSPSLAPCASFSCSARRSASPHRRNRRRHARRAFRRACTLALLACRGRACRCACGCLRRGSGRGGAIETRRGGA